MNALKLALALGLSAAIGGVTPAFAEDGEVTEEELSGRNLTSKQKLDFAKDAEDTVRGQVTEVTQQTEKAGESNDTVLLNCLNDKLGLMVKVRDVIVDSRGLLVVAIEGENGDDQEYYFRRIYIAKGESNDLYAEAQSCVNSRGFIAGGTQVQVKVKSGGDAGQGGDSFGSANSGGTRPESASE